jgi:hypothetical protein
MDLEPIETHLRDEDAPDDAVVLLRGGPMVVEKLVEHAFRQMRDFSWQDQPMASISVDGMVGGWTEELLLRERLWSRSNFARATVGAVRAAGFVVLPTHDVPHFDVVLAEASSDEAARLLAVFGPAVNNPYKRRRR